jgi:hypothetical protein
VKTNQEINANLLVRIAFGVKGFKNFSLLLEFFVQMGLIGFRYTASLQKLCTLLHQVCHSICQYPYCSPEFDVLATITCACTVINTHTKMLTHIGHFSKPQDIPLAKGAMSLNQRQAAI